MSKDSTETSESDSTPSTPLSPRWTSTLCTEEAMTPALVPSRPPSPAPADNSLEVRQFYREQTGHAFTHQEFRKCDDQAKQRAAVLKQVAQLECNQLPKQQPAEPQPGPSGESNTCTVSERSSIKGTCQCNPTWSSSFTL